MSKILSSLVAAVFVAGIAGAQVTHQVDATGITFVDQASLSNVTTITIGDTVQWNFISGGSHTVTSGTGFGDPNMGVLFNSSLDFGTPVFSYTPTAIGVINYFCQPHIACCNMIGSIIVLAPPSYPGSGDDLAQTTAIGAANLPNPIDVKQANAFDILKVKVASPGGALDFKPILMGAQLMAQGGPAPFGVLPNLYLTSPGAVVLVDGYSASAIGFLQVILPGGTTYGFQLPPGLAGQAIMIQTLVVAPGVALPPGVARSAGHEIQMIS